VNKNESAKLMLENTVQHVQPEVYIRTKPKNLCTIQQIPIDGFFDLMCQVCDVCEYRGGFLLLVWDATITK